MATHATAQAYADELSSTYGVTLGASELEAWSEFCHRLEDRDGEIGRDLLALLTDAFVLRSAYNVGSGATALGLKLTALTLGNAPTWGANGMAFASASNQYASASGPLATGTAWTVFTDVTSAVTGSMYYVSQWDRGGTNTGEIIAAQVAAGSQYAWAADGTSINLDTQTYGPGARRFMVTERDASAWQAAHPQRLDRFASGTKAHTSPGYAFTIGGSSNHAAERAFQGTAHGAIVLAATLTEAEWDAVQVIWEETVLAGVPPALSTHLAYAAASSDLTEHVAYNEATTNGPASLTKLATSYLVVREIATLSDTVTVTADDVNVTGSVAGLQAGDVLTWEDILYAMMLPSGNDAANVAARVIGQQFLDAESGGAGDPVARFITEMDALATSLGATNTTYSTPSGVTGGSTTAYDQALMLRNAASDATLRTVMGTATHDVTITGSNARTISLTNTHDMIESGDARVIAGKTGTNSASGSNLATLATIDGDEVLIVTLGGDHDAGRYADAERILTYVDSLSAPATPITATGRSPMEALIETPTNLSVSTTGISDPLQALRAICTSRSIANAATLPDETQALRALAADLSVTGAATLPDPTAALQAIAAEIAAAEDTPRDETQGYRILAEYLPTV